MKFRLRNLILLLMVPALLVQVLIIARWNYGDLRDAIMRGFDRKLLAISTVTASFIDGNEQRKILDLVQPRGAAFDPKNASLYISYFMHPQIAVLNRAGTLLRTINIEDEYVLEDIAYSSVFRKVVGYDQVAMELISINPNTGKVNLLISSDVFKALDDHCFALAEQNQVLYCAGAQTLYAIDQKSLEIKPITSFLNESGAPYVGDIWGLSPSNSNNLLYGYDTYTKKLFLIEINSGKMQELKLTDFLTSKITAADYLERTTLGLAYDQVTGKLYSGSTMPILEIDLGKKAIYPKDSNFQKKESAVFNRYLRSLLQIKINRDITFLTVGTVTERGKKLVYVMDPEQRSDMAPIGYQDIDDIDEGVADVFFKGKTFISEPTYWVEWGTLKTGYAPITNDQNQITGISVADISISVIDEKTRDAQVRIFSVGLLLLIGSTIAGLFITKRLIQPISQLKEVALKVAAGMYDQQITIKEPKELEELSSAFNDLSSSLNETLQELNISNKNIARMRNQSEIERIIERRIASKKYHDQAGINPFSCCFDVGSRTIIWVSNKEDSYQATKENLAISQFCSTFAKNETKPIAEVLLETFPDTFAGIIEVVFSKRKASVAFVEGPFKYGSKDIQSGDEARTTIEFADPSRSRVFEAKDND